MKVSESPKVVGGGVDSAGRPPRQGWAAPYLSPSYVGGVVLLAASYVVLAKLGLQLSVTRPTLVWAPSGLALGVLLMYGFRMWPGVALGAIVETLTTGAPVFFAVGTGVGAVAAGGTAIVLLRRIGFQTSLERVRDVLGLVLLGAAASSVVSTAVGITSRCIVTPTVCGAYGSSWWVWWLGEAIGIIVLTPVVLVLASGPFPALSRRKVVEIGAWTVCTAVLMRFEFGDWSVLLDLRRELPIAYFIFPLQLWAVFRFRQRGAVVASAVVVLIAMYGTARGFGPFVSDTLDQDIVLLWVWVFATLVSVTTMLLAAVIAERELAVEESGYQRDFAAQIMNALGQGVTVTDADGQFEFVNPAYAEMVGRPAAALIGVTPEQITPSENHPPVDMMDMAGKAGSKFTYEVRVARPDGRIVYALVTGTPRLRGGKVVGSITVVTDVTESKKAQEALRSSELRFRTMVQRHQAAMFLVDERGEIVDANSAAEMLFGYPRDALRGMMVGDLTGEPLEDVLEAIRPKDEAQSSVVLPGKLADGRVRQVEVYSSPIEYGEGELLFLIVHDVTERETAQDALRESEERYRELVELSPEPIVVHSEVEVVYANPAAVRLLGAAGLDEIIGKRLLDFVHPDSREDYINRRRQFEGAAEPEHTGAFRLQRIDGRARDIEFASGPIQLLGQPARQIVIRDVTEKRRAEAALRESEAQLRTLVEYAPEAIVVLDVEAGRFAHVNENAVRMFGYSRSDLRRMGPGDVSPPNQPDGMNSEQHIREHLRLAIAGETPVFEWTHRNAAGEDIPCEIHLVRMPATGRVLIRGSVTDITERKRLEEQLMQSQKMEAIGRLAGGIAHDFNNLTTAILGYGELTVEGMDDDDPLRPNLEQIQKAAGRAADLTRQLLAFARKQVTQPKVIQLNELVTNLEEMLRRFTGEDVEFVSSLAPDIHPVRIDPGQFEQVLLNLVVNGRDAMPDGGQLTIETSNVLVDGDFAAQHPPMIPGAYVLLRVSDTGVGMDDKVIKHIFEPFFTTKSRVKGTGLGLATCYGIVKQAAGYIWASSKPNSGASFSIYLPRDDETPIPAAAVAQTESPSTGAESVLLVEDELMVREMVEKILHVHGYRVITASGGEEALAIANDMNGEIDLLLTDVVMPKMSGGELARTLVAQHPDLKVLFMSGYTEDAAVHQGRLEHGADFLQKPFSPRDLAKKVRKVLDSQIGDDA